MNSNFLIGAGITGVGAIVAIVITIVLFIFLYTKVLQKYIGKWVDPVLSKIPWYGAYVLGKSGLGIADSIAFSRANLGSKRPQSGSRGGTRAKGHGKACAWYPELCNVWENTKLKDFTGGTEHGEEQTRILAEDEERARKYRELWEPMSRKVFTKMGSSKSTPGNFQDVLNTRTAMTDKVNSVFGNDNYAHVRRGNDQVNTRFDNFKLT